MSLIVDAISYAGRSPKSRNPLGDRRSIEFQFRSRRFAQVGALIDQVLDEQGHCKIVDLGGTEQYWAIAGSFLGERKGKISITLVNLEREPVRDNRLFHSMAGDASSPSVLDGAKFDLAHSNSVIEHVGDDAAMAGFAENVRRLAPRYYVQTPNYWFPYEPHFQLPFFQYLPEAARVQIIRNFAVGYFDKIDNAAEAWDIIKHHRMIGSRQMAAFFPDAEISFEKVAKLNKSIIAIRNQVSRERRLFTQTAPALVPDETDFLALDSASQMPPNTNANAIE